MEPTTVAVCDMLGCPAFAVDELIIHGQDFRFCHHHGLEVAAVLIVPAGRLSPRSRNAAPRPTVRKVDLVSR